MPLVSMTSSSPENRPTDEPSGDAPRWARGRLELNDARQVVCLAANQQLSPCSTISIGYGLIIAYGMPGTSQSPTACSPPS